MQQQPDFFTPLWRRQRSIARRLVVEPTERFIGTEVSGGVVLVIAALAGLIWANIDNQSYYDFWHTQIAFDLGVHVIEDTLGHFVNGALMVIFFLVVGAEIKREAVHGELRDLRQATLPIAAAAGGMIVPALVYVAFNAGGDGGAGWGIPVATDIAFALGVLALVGPKIPIQLKIFLLTLAVADDVGGILIIAIFYADEIQLPWLLGGLGTVGFLVAARQVGVRHFSVHALGGFFLWLCLWEGGVEATLAGVVLGLIVPAQSLYNADGTSRRLDYLLQRYQHAIEDPDPDVAHADADEALRGIRHVALEAQSPLERVEEEFARISAFVVVPIFALSNAGVQITGDKISDAASSDVAIGIFLGLLAGKLIGVVGGSWLVIRLGISHMPSGMRWPDIVGASLLAGIGFTVAIFIGSLAFDDQALTEEAKIGIFAASIVAAVLGYLILRLFGGQGGDEYVPSAAVQRRSGDTEWAAEAEEPTDTPVVGGGG